MKNLKTEFDYLMAAETLYCELERKGYKIHSDRHGGVMVKGSGIGVYTNLSEFKGDSEGERIYKQAEALCDELGESTTYGLTR